MKHVLLWNLIVYTSLYIKKYTCHSHREEDTNRLKLDTAVYEHEEVKTDLGDISPKHAVTEGNAGSPDHTQLFESTPMTP